MSCTRPPPDVHVSQILRHGEGDRVAASRLPGGRFLDNGSRNTSQHRTLETEDFLSVKAPF